MCQLFFKYFLKKLEKQTAAWYTVNTGGSGSVILQIVFGLRFGINCMFFKKGTSGFGFDTHILLCVPILKGANTS